MKSDYARDYYAARHRNTVYAARTVLSIVLDALPPVHSAIDLGCGVGTWLSVLRERGVPVIRGLDGPWVAQELLEIPGEDFQVADLGETLAHDRRYDLAISLEVAEHIPEASAGTFVDSLIGASDFVLFSAAIPFQGGVGHVNEQWPDYWAQMFAARGYVARDIVRGRIWNDRRIPFWYRQNVLLFAREEREPGVRSAGVDEPGTRLPMPLVHPALYLSKTSGTGSEPLS